MTFYGKDPSQPVQMCYLSREIHSDNSCFSLETRFYKNFRQNLVVMHREDKTGTLCKNCFDRFVREKLKVANGDYDPIRLLIFVCVIVVNSEFFTVKDHGLFIRFAL